MGTAWWGRRGEAPLSCMKHMHCGCSTAAAQEQLHKARLCSCQRGDLAMLAASTLHSASSMWHLRHTGCVHGAGTETMSLTVLPALGDAGEAGVGTALTRSRTMLLGLTHSQLVEGHGDAHPQRGIHAECDKVPCALRHCMAGQPDCERDACEVGCCSGHHLLADVQQPDAIGPLGVLTMPAWWA